MHSLYCRACSFIAEHIASLWVSKLGEEVPRMSCNIFLPYDEVSHAVYTAWCASPARLILSSKDLFECFNWWLMCQHIPFVHIEGSSRSWKKKGSLLETMEWSCCQAVYDFFLTKCHYITDNLAIGSFSILNRSSVLLLISMGNQTLPSAKPPFNESQTPTTSMSVTGTNSSAENATCMWTLVGRIG